MTRAVAQSPYAGLPELDYPFHDKAVTVTTCGRICSSGRRSISARSSPGKPSASSRFENHLWLASFLHYDLAYFDDETCRIEPIADPFGPNMLPMSPG